MKVLGRGCKGWAGLEIQGPDLDLRVGPGRSWLGWLFKGGVVPVTAIRLL